MNTFESILKRLQEAYTGPAGTQEGSVVGDVLQAVANELARMYSQELEPMEDSLFLTTAAGSRLDALCANYGIQRLEQENDNKLRKRALAQIREPALAGNAAHYAAWAAEVPGVLRAEARAGVRGPGTVDVYYIPAADAGEDLWHRLQAHLEACCPLGAEVLALEAMAYELQVDTYVDLQETALLSQVRSACTAALEAYFAEIALTEAGKRISPSRLTALLLDCAGVLDVNTLTVNDRDYTQILPDGSYPRLSGLTLEKVQFDG